MASFDVQAALDDDDNPLRADDDDPNGAMSQLAALITENEDIKRKKKPTPKSDPIAAILASAGVEYTHENSEVVGSSKVEERLSRRAEETGGEIGYGEELLFGPVSIQAGNGNIRYEFHPPEDVMKRQFCTMAKTFGFSSATEFAFVVEGWTQKQRTDCLERFYLKRRERLEELDKEKAEKENAERMKRAREQAKAEMEGETASDNDEL